MEAAIPFVVVPFPTGVDKISVASTASFCAHYKSPNICLGVCLKRDVGKGQKLNE